MKHTPPDNTVGGALPQASARVWLLGAIQVLAVACAFLLILPYLLSPLYRVVDPVSTLMLWRLATRAPVERGGTPIGFLAPTLSRSLSFPACARVCSPPWIYFSSLPGRGKT